jgi:transcriptional regulator with XRE-family HTH domain
MGSTAVDRWTTPPEVPAEFWTHASLVEALTARHMGRVLRAYRHHPWHGHRPLPQQVVGGWLGTEQGRVSKIETGSPSQKLDWLRFVARLLRIPAELLWFAVDTVPATQMPPDDGGDPPPRNDRLKAARLRMRSPADPRLRMSRAELADAVNAYLADNGLPPLYLTSVYVGKLERGMARWPRTNLRRALRAVLGVAADSDLGFFPTRHDEAERLTHIGDRPDSLSVQAPLDLTAAAVPDSTSTTGTAVTSPSQVTVSVETGQPGRVVVTVSVAPFAEATAEEIDDPAAGVYSLSRARDARAGRMGRLA